MSKFWKFIDASADNSSGTSDAVRELNDGTVELRIEGTIIDDDTSFMSEIFGIPIPDTQPTASQFRNELNKYSGRPISVFIDSFGGSFFTGTGINIALNDMKKTGSKITTRAGARCMSAASIIFAAGDERLVSPGSLILIHRSAVNDASGNGNELIANANYLFALDDVMAEIYTDIMNNVSKDDVMSLMDKTTTFNAKQALENGFATKIENDGNNSAVAFAGNSHILSKLNLVQVNASVEAGMKADRDLLNRIKPSGVRNQIKQEVNDMEIKSAEDLEKNYPDFVASIVNNKIVAEKKRVNDLISAGKGGNPAVAEVVEKAISDGKTLADVKGYIDIVAKYSVDPNAKANNNSTPDPKSGVVATVENAVADGDPVSFYKEVMADYRKSKAQRVQVGAANTPAENAKEQKKAVANIANLINASLGTAKKAVE